MRVAYADPPYPGQAHLYRSHPDYAGEVDHHYLIERLERDFPDGWALSTSVTGLPGILNLVTLGRGLRLCAWNRGVVPRPPARIMWSWEPVIVCSPNWRLRHDSDYVRDSLVAMQPSGFLGGTIKGQKPVLFCYWVFDLLGLGPDDELVDIFPGSGAVGHAWDAWKRQLNLFTEMAS
jgi:hypothetical protein